MAKPPRTGDVSFDGLISLFFRSTSLSVHSYYHRYCFQNRAILAASVSEKKKKKKKSLISFSWEKIHLLRRFHPTGYPCFYLDNERPRRRMDETPFPAPHGHSISSLVSPWASSDRSRSWSSASPWPFSFPSSAPFLSFGNTDSAHSLLLRPPPWWSRTRVFSSSKN